MCQCVTMDERWLHHFILESNRRSAEWTARDKSTRKRGITQRSAGKAMASAFWDVRGIKFIGYFEKEKNINPDYCITEAFEIRNRGKSLYLKKKKVLFHQNNALCLKSMKTMSKLHELGFELLPHPPYSADLASSDFFLLLGLKRMLAGKRFRADKEAIEETEVYFETKDKSYCENRIEKLYGRYNRCIALEGNYIE